MADGSATKSPTRGSHTICLPVAKGTYSELVRDAAAFRAWLLEAFVAIPEAFPAGFGDGFEMKDLRVSKKLNLPLRRVLLRDGSAFTIRPSFAMPYMTACAEEVEKALFLRKFAVPYWALAYVFGRNSMYWYRLECHFGRNSIVGTTVRKAKIPKQLLADEHHQTRDGEKVYLATTVGDDCCLGVGVAEDASTEQLTQAYGEFREEALNVEPDYLPETVNTDGWKGTRAAWPALFPTIILLRCFLHAWLKIRDRGKNLKDTFYELSRRVWEVYHAPNKRSQSQRIRHLRIWANANLTGTVLVAVLDLCDKKDAWLAAHDYPEGHHTSNMLDRMMRSMNRYFTCSQHLHGKKGTRHHVRAYALLHNFTPWNPVTTKANNGWKSPAERLNKHRYHHDWLQNLLVSASMNGFRIAPQKA